MLKCAFDTFQQFLASGTSREEDYAMTLQTPKNIYYSFNNLFTVNYKIVEDFTDLCVTKGALYKVTSRTKTDV